MMIIAKKKALCIAALIVAALLLGSVPVRAEVKEVEKDIPNISSSFNVRFTDSSTMTNINTALREEVARHDLTLFMQFSPG